MSEILTLQLIAVRDLDTSSELEQRGHSVRSSELVRCRHCSVRYWLLMEFSEMPLNYEFLDAIDIRQALVLVANKVASEHAAGHPSRRFAMTYRCQTHWLCKHIQRAGTLPGAGEKLN